MRLRSFDIVISLCHYSYLSHNIWIVLSSSIMIMRARLFDLNDSHILSIRSIYIISRLANLHAIQSINISLLKSDLMQYYQREWCRTMGGEQKEWGDTQMTQEHITNILVTVSRLYNNNSTHTNTTKMMMIIIDRCIWHRYSNTYRCITAMWFASLSRITIIVLLLPVHSHC